MTHPAQALTVSLLTLLVVGCSARTEGTEVSTLVPDSYSDADRLVLPGESTALNATCDRENNPADFTPAAMMRRLSERVPERFRALDGEVPGGYTRELQLDFTFATCQTFGQRTQESLPGSRPTGALVEGWIYLRGVLFLRSDDAKIDLRMPVALRCEARSGCTFLEAETRINRGTWRGQVHGPDEAAKFTFTRGVQLDWWNGAARGSQLVAMLSP